MDSTKEIKVPKNIIGQVIGQDEAVDIIKKAALQRRHVLLIGEPGTGKSMLGLALAELLPKEKLQDIISLPNPNDENTPLIKTVKAGTGREEIKKSQLQAKQFFKNQNFLFFILAIAALIAPWWIRHSYKSDLMFTAFFLGGMLFLVGLVFMLNMGPRMTMSSSKILHPKLIVDNYGKKQAPFFDATGSHAGALLGDILHDPFQCLNSSNKVNIINDKNQIKESAVQKLIDNKFTIYKKSIIKKKEKNYESVHLPKKELFVLGETNNSVSPVEVLSSNRHNHNSEMIKLTTSENKELIVTPEHKIALWKNGKIDYVEAKKIKKEDQVVAKTEDIIIDEQDIINTYDERQQKQCKLYYQYKKLKKENPFWGYKRIAKLEYYKTRWWHTGKHIPVPVQTVNWLKRRKLLPLKIDNPKLPLIAKVIGATFGDGGIFENLNAVFLSSSELEATQEFGRDLMDIFGYSIDNNMRTIEGGIEGHSFCYQNTNRNIIRFFKALGAPIGKKTNVNFITPTWIYLLTKLEDEFYGSLMGNELGVPKVHKQRNRLDMLSLGITGNSKTVDSKIGFLEKLKEYLEKKGIKSTSINKRKGKTEGTTICRLIISSKFDNVVSFLKNIKINYCKYKKEKLVKTVNEFKVLKKRKYDELIRRNCGAEHAMKLLQLTPQSLYTVLNEEKITL